MINSKYTIKISDAFALFALLSISFLNSSYNIRYILMIITAIWLFLMYGKKRNIPKIKGIYSYIPILIVMLGGCSLLNSGYWSTGYLRYGLLLYETVLAYFIYFNISDFKRIFYRYFVALIWINLFLMIFMRETSFYTYYTGESLFRGLYYEKNTLGFNMVMGLPFFVGEISEEDGVKKKVKNIFYILTSFTFIYLSKSTTSLLIGILICVAAFLNKDNIMKLARIFPILALAFVLYLVNYEAVINSSLNVMIDRILGKGMDFSGRSTLWFFSLQLITRRPLFGYGYNGFWSDTANAKIAMNTAGFAAVGYHAHNGYLELLVSVGIIGTAVFVIILLNIYVQLRKKDVLQWFTKGEILLFIIILVGNFIWNNLFDTGLVWAYLIMLFLRIDVYKKNTLRGRCVRAIC